MALKVIFIGIFVVLCIVFAIKLYAIRNREISEKDIARMTEDEKKFAIKCLIEFKRPIFSDEFKLWYNAYCTENSITARDAANLDKANNMIRLINDSLHRGHADE